MITHQIIPAAGLRGWAVVEMDDDMWSLVEQFQSLH
jgi:hypothetical protein